MAGMRTTPSLMARPQGMSMSQLSQLQRARRRNRTRPMPGRTIHERDAADRLFPSRMRATNPSPAMRESNPCSIQKAGGKKWRCCSSGSTITCDDITTIDPFAPRPLGLMGNPNVPVVNPRGGGLGNPVTAVSGGAHTAFHAGQQNLGFRSFGFRFPFYGYPYAYGYPYSYPYTPPYAYASLYASPYGYGGYPPVSAAYAPGPYASGYYQPWWRYGGVPRYSAAVIA